VQQRFPVGRNPLCRPGRWLVRWMRMWRKQLHTLDHSPLLVIIEPILTRLEAGDDRMPRCRRMLGCMLTRRTVAAADVSTLRTATKMKPPASRRRQAFDTPKAARLRSGVDPALVFFHFQFSFCHLATAAIKPEQHWPRNWTMVLPTPSYRPHYLNALGARLSPSSSAQGRSRTKPPMAHRYEGVVDTIVQLFLHACVWPNGSRSTCTWI